MAKPRMLIVEDTHNHAYTQMHLARENLPQVEVDLAMSYDRALRKIQQQDEHGTPYAAILIDTTIAIPEEEKNHRTARTHRAEDVIYSVLHNKPAYYDSQHKEWCEYRMIPPFHLSDPTKSHIVMMADPGKNILRDIVNRIGSFEPKSLLRGDGVYTSMETTKAWRRIGLQIGIDPRTSSAQGRSR